MNGRAASFCAWVAIVAVVAGCGGAPVRDATPTASASMRFRLAADGLPAEGLWKSTPVLADVNNDGFPDLAIHPRLANGPKVFLGTADGKWRDSSEGLGIMRSCGGGIQFADVNKDGKLDLVIADHCAGVFVFLGDGRGNWQAVTQGMSSAFSRGETARKAELDEAFKGAEAVAVGDVDGDGFPDLVVSSSDHGGLAVYLGDGTGRNWREVERSGLPYGEYADALDVYHGGWAFDLQLTDVNGDGRLDVVASYYTGPRVWWGDGKGGFVDHSQGLIKTRMGGIYGRMAVGDLNGDGRPDLVIANNANGAEAYLQNADGTWKGPIDVMPELKGGAQAVAIGDVDGDGKLDVVIGGIMTSGINYEWLPHGLWIRWGDGKGGFSDRPTTNLPDVGLEIIWGIKVGDVNRDGRPDIVVSSGGASGKITFRPGMRMPDGRTPPEQKAFPVPTLQVWLNEGVGRP